LAAFGQEVKGVDGNNPTGVYTLVTVNGSKLPATVSHGDAVIEVRSGTFTINADGTCRSKVSFGPPSGAEFTREVDATYTREGSKLNMQWKGAGMTTGVVKSDTFTMDNEGMVFAYRKQPALPTGDGQLVLDRFIGTWRTDYRSPKAEWTPVEKTGSAALTYSRVLGGQFVQEQGTHADDRTALLMYTYDAREECYRLWWFSSTGQSSLAKGVWDSDTNTLTWTYRASAEQEFTMTASHHFVSDDVFEWDLVGKDATGKILFQTKGNASRTTFGQKESKE